MDIVIAADEDGIAYAVPAPPAGHWRFWATLGWAILIVVLSNLIQGVVMIAGAVREYSRHPHPDTLTVSRFMPAFTREAGHGNIIFWAVIVANAICCGLIVLLIKLKNRETLAEYLRLRPVSPLTLLKWVGIATVFLVGAEFVIDASHADLGGAVMKKLMKDTDSPWLFWLAIVLAAPLFEEIFFRGFIFRGFETSFLGTPGTIALTAILWAAMHVQYTIYGMAFIFCTGIVFGAARAQTRSLFVPLTLHGAMNATDLIGSALGGN